MNLPKMPDKLKGHLIELSFYTLFIILILIFCEGEPMR